VARGADPDPHAALTCGAPARSCRSSACPPDGPPTSS
jgi:hypothetical protein